MREGEESPARSGMATPDEQPDSPWRSGLFVEGQPGSVLDRFETHTLKVVPPYLDALRDGGKTFEVRKNDRAYQRGDLLILNEWHPARFCDPSCHRCMNAGWDAHYTGRKAVRWVTYVYAGDPRFSGIEPGHVVLGLGFDDHTKASEGL